MSRAEPDQFHPLLVFAVVLVIYGNGMVLTGVPATGLWGAPFAQAGTDLLFAIGGYGAMAAWQRAGGLRPYLARRVVRGLPGLAACVLATVFVIGPLATTLPLRSYFLSAATRGYLANAVLVLKLWLPGVFEGQQWSGTVNPMLGLLVPGALGVVLAPPLLGRLPWRAGAGLAFAAGAVCVAAVLAYPPTPGAPQVLLFRVPLLDMVTAGPFLLAGIGLRVLETRPGAPPALWRADLAMLCFAANWAVASWVGPWTLAIEWLTLPYMACCFGRMQGLPWPRALGRPAYGMFLFAFPIQQTIVARWPGNPQPILTCMALAFLAGVLSWHLVERPALRRAAAA